MPNFQLSGNPETQQLELDQLRLVVRHRIEQYIEDNEMQGLTGRLQRVETPQNLLDNSLVTLIFLCFENHQQHEAIRRQLNGRVCILGHNRGIRPSDREAYHNNVPNEPSLIDTAVLSIEMTHTNYDLSVAFYKVVVDKLIESQRAVQQQQQNPNLLDQIQQMQENAEQQQQQNRNLLGQIRQMEQNAEQQQQQNRTLQEQVQQLQQQAEQQQRKHREAQQLLAASRARVFDMEREVRRREDVRRLREEWSELERVQDNNNVNNNDDIPNTQ